MKKTWLLALSLLFVLVLAACGGNNGDEDPIVEPDVESVEITNQETTLSVGSHTLTGRALPANASQMIRYTLLGSPEGVSLTGDQLTVGVSAEDGLTFQVRITSIYDPIINSITTFTVLNPATDSLEIFTEEDLLAIHDNLSASYKLMNHIELTSPWTPIGVADIEEDNGNIIPGTYFNGTFDGQGFSITNIQINGEFTEGVFAQTGATAVIENLHVQGTLEARGWSGGIVGINGGTIRNVVVDIDTTLLGGSGGALVAVNRGTITNSIALGAVVTETPVSNPRSSGLVAANEGILTEVFGDKDTLQTPNYIAFTPTQNTTYMLSTAEMKTASNFAAFDTVIWFIADGFYPMLRHEGFEEPTELEITLSISNTESTIDVEVTETLQITVNVVNALDPDLSYELLDEYPGVSINQDGLLTFTTDVVHLSTFSVRVFLTENPDVYANKTFNIVYNPVPTGDIIYITNEAELHAFATQTNPSALALTYKLANDIALEGWFNVSIGNETTPFTGIFDGQGYTISGFKGGDMQHNFGMFGVIGIEGIVKNFSLIGADRAADMYVGAAGAPIASLNNGLIENIFTELTILSTGQWVGGFVANNNGTIRNVIARNKVYINDSFATSGPGFAIGNEGTIENAYVDAEFTGLTKFFHAEDAIFDAFLVNNAFLTTASNFVAFDSNIWLIEDGSIPALKVYESLDAIMISTEAELHALATQTNPEALALTYKLANDIVLEGWYLSSIGNETTPFTGIFDGQGYTISGFKGGDMQHNFGMFGVIGIEGVVKNFSLIGADREADLYVGAGTAVLASENRGLIENIFTEVTIMSTGQWVGGFVANNFGTIRNVITRNKVYINESVATFGPGFAIGNEGTIDYAYVDAEFTGLTKFFHAEDAIFDAFLVNNAFLTTASNFAAFDPTIWAIVDGSIPTLINPSK